jgi:hypothetical protein
MLHDEAKAAVLAAIRAGHSIRSIHQQELALPDRRTITLWLNTDLVFAAAFAQAEKDRGPLSFRKLQMYRERKLRGSRGLAAEILDKILTSVESGNTLYLTLKPKGMPDRKTVRDYAKTDPEFARRLIVAREAFGSGEQRKQQFKTRRDSANRYLAKFPEIIRRMTEGEFVTALLAEMNFGQRSFAGFLKRHPEQYQQLIETRRSSCRGRFAPEHYAQSLAQLVVDISTPVDEFKPERLPGYHAMYARCAHHPEFAEAFAAARRERIAKRCEVASISPKRKWVKHHDAARPVYGTAMLRGQLLQDELYRAANAAVGEFLPDRDDVIADLIEAALSGSVPIDDMASYEAEFASDHNRRMGFKKALSLDAKVSDDGDETFIERLTSDDYSFAE